MTPALVRIKKKEDDYWDISVSRWFKTPDGLDTESNTTASNLTFSSPANNDNTSLFWMFCRAWVQTCDAECIRMIQKYSDEGNNSAAIVDP